MFDYTVQATDKEHMLTEIRYVLAHARCNGCELVRLRVADEAKQGGVLLRELKESKKQRVIRFFLADSAIGTGSAEARYLSNKYPQAAKRAEDELPYYIICL